MGVACRLRGEVFRGRDVHGGREVDGGGRAAGKHGRSGGDAEGEGRNERQEEEGLHATAGSYARFERIETDVLMVRVLYTCFALGLSLRV
jgi:hypothetical protein